MCAVHVSTSLRSESAINSHHNKCFVDQVLKTQTNTHTTHTHTKIPIQIPSLNHICCHKYECKTSREWMNWCWFPAPPPPPPHTVSGLKTSKQRVKAAEAEKITISVPWSWRWCSKSVFTLWATLLVTWKRFRFNAYQQSRDADNGELVELLVQDDHTGNGAGTTCPPAQRPGACWEVSPPGSPWDTT